MTENQYAPQQSQTATAPENTSVESPKPASEEPAWYLDENTPGQGPRPDWLPQKYKRASDAGKGYTELEKRFGGFTGAPEEYDLSSLELDDDGTVVQAMTSVAKELNMSQEGLNKFLGRLVTASETENTLNLEEQVKKMGEDGKRKISEFNNWTKNYLSAEEAEVVIGMVRTAEELSVFNRMMASTHMPKVPTSQTTMTANHFETVESLRGELTKNISKYENDRAYQKDYSTRMSRAMEREGRR